jgi:septal ring factor EnvC (AmiA/AmiB activator)
MYIDIPQSNSKVNTDILSYDFLNTYTENSLVIPYLNCVTSLTGADRAIEALQNKQESDDKLEEVKKELDELSKRKEALEKNLLFFEDKIKFFQTLINAVKDEEKNS